MAGFTTVRDVGGWNHAEMAVREAAKQGHVIAPRLFLAGKLLSITTSGADYYPGMYEICDGVEQVIAGARRQIAKGADLIKVMATGAMLSPESEDSRAIQFTRAELEAAVAVARDNYKHVAAHAHAVDGILNAVEAGAGSIEHGTFADRAVLQLMAKKGTFLVPTLCPRDHPRARARAPCRHRRTAPQGDPPGPPTQGADRHGHRRRHAGQPSRRQRPGDRRDGDRRRPDPGCGHLCLDRRSPWAPMPARRATITATTPRRSSRW
jgi:hypothetical protein